MLLILILFNLYLALADDNCSSRTTIYDSECLLNINNYCYDIRTHNTDLAKMDPQSYRKYIQDTISCTGIWCIDGKWRCPENNSKDCYNVEHIIPKSNNIGEIIGCDTNIRSNYIMAYGAWNQALGNSYYGEDIVKSAYKSIYFVCHNRYPEKFPEELCVSQELMRFQIALIVALSFVGLWGITFAIVLSINEWLKRKDETYAIH